MKIAAATNKALPKAGLNSFPACRTGRDWTFVHGSTFVLRLNFCTKNSQHRQSQTVVCKFDRTTYLTISE
jgi:hypothetical protein